MVVMMQWERRGAVVGGRVIWGWGSVRWRWRKCREQLAEWLSRQRPNVLWTTAPRWQLQQWWRQWVYV